MGVMGVTVLRLSDPFEELLKDPSIRQTYIGHVRQHYSDSLSGMVLHCNPRTVHVYIHMTELSNQAAYIPGARVVLYLTQTIWLAAGCTGWQYC